LRPVPDARADDLEREIGRIGTALAAEFPSGMRHPVKALDARAELFVDLATAAQPE
jgi:hypothetical protein